MTTIFLTYQNSSIEALYQKGGDQLLIMFHGFGDSAHLFKNISEALKVKFTVYALSLPYHGATVWIPNIFSRKDIENLIRLILEREQKQRFSILGYSMGGKISLCMIETFAPLINAVFLFAPDGIKTHPLYDTSRLPMWFLRLARCLMTMPRLFFGIAKIGFRFGILSQFLYDFTLNHFETQTQRRRFFSVSHSIKDFIPNISLIQSLLNQYQIPVELFYGKRDEVILIEGAKEFILPLKNASLQVLDKGHLMIDDDLNHLLLQKWKKQPIIF
ncbi:MAG: hypothetical protein OHK0038_21300 [Flammeovirgaceae bacterium]